MTIQLTKYNPRRSIRKKLEKHRTLQKIFTAIYLKYCSLTGFLHVFPDFLIIGFPKCGTTSIFEYLIQHPCVYPPKGKEIDYFDRLYNYGINWYRASFPLRIQKYFLKKFLGKNILTGDATPRYADHPYAIQRIKEIIPDVKLIILLRNPIDRAFSHYNMNRRNKWEHLSSFEDAIKNEKNRIKGRYEKMKKNPAYFSWDYDLYGYLEHGLYVDKLKRCMEVFPREQFLIIQSEEFLSDPSKVYNQVLKFLGLPKWELAEYKQYKKNPTNILPIAPEHRKQLVEYFSPHNQRLYEFLGTDFHWDE